MLRVTSYFFAWSLLCVALSATASGEIVLFGGRFTSGTGSLLGDLPPQRDFNVQLNFDSLNPGIGRIQSGILTFSDLSLNITGGDIFLSNSDTSSDQATFLFNTSGPTGALNVSFFGDAINDNLVNRTNLDSLIRVGSPAFITANFGAAGSYTGTVTAVPEPTSMVLVGIGVLVTGAGSGWRNRMKRKSQI